MLIRLAFFICLSTCLAFQVPTHRHLISLNARVSTTRHFGGISSSICDEIFLGGKCVDVLVVGSGLSGSTAAFYLNKGGANVMVAESRPEVGGSVSTKQKDGFLWEEGANSFQPNPTILRYAKDLGILDEMVLADSKLPRFIYWENKLFALPSRIIDICSLKLLTWPAKIRMILGVLGFISKKPPDTKEESIKEWITRHLGDEVFTRIIDPFVSGVYAGDPSKLSMRAALKKIEILEDIGVNRGIFSGGKARFAQIKAERILNKDRDSDLPSIPSGSLGSFNNGMQSMPNQVAHLLNDKFYLEHELVKVSQEKSATENNENNYGSGKNRKWLAQFRTKSGAIKTVRAKSLFITVPSHVIAPLIGGETGMLPEANELNKISYPPVACVVLAYANEAFQDGPPIRSGFGHLIPRAMKVRTLGTIWSSSLFPGRCPPGYSLLTSFIGGSQDTAIAGVNSQEIVNIVHSDLIKTTLLKKDAAAPRVLSVRMWPRAIPQYNKGHVELINKVQQACETKAPGLYLGGNYATGVAVGDCIAYGADIANDILTYLAENKH